MHAISIEITSAGNLEGPCTTKVCRRIAYAHWYAGKVCGRFKPFPSYPVLSLRMNHAYGYKSARNNTVNTNFIKHVALFAARMRRREGNDPYFGVRRMVIVRDHASRRDVTILRWRSASVASGR